VKEISHTTTYPAQAQLLFTVYTHASGEHVCRCGLHFNLVLYLFQTSEEELFGNKHHSPAMDEFLDLIGHRVQLKDFIG
jgi:hypothetical protein